MDFNQSIYYLEKRGNLKGLSEEEKEDLINLCEKSYFFYDPYKNVFINPFNKKSITPKAIQSAFQKDKYGLTDQLNYQLPVELNYQKTIVRIIKNHSRAILVQNIFSYFKWIGLIVGIFIGFFVDPFFGLALGFYLIHIDYNLYDSVNGIKDQIQGGFGTTLQWKQKRYFYFFGSIVLLLLSLIFFYFYVNSFLIPIIFFVFQKWLIFNPLIRWISSSNFQGTEIIYEIEKNYEKEKIPADLKEEIKESITKESVGIKSSKIIYPIFLKLYDVEFYSDIIDDDSYGQQLDLNYDTNLKQQNTVNIIVRSKKSITLKLLNNYINSPVFLKQFKIFVENPLVEFIYSFIKTEDPNSYFIVSKGDFYSIYSFEGDYSNNILRSFHSNGQVDCYSEYSMGAKNGLYREFFENGILHFQSEFSEGALVEGEKIWYHENGTIMMRGNIKHKEKDLAVQPDLYNPDSNKRIGLWEKFDNQGNRIKSVRYFDGSEKEVEYESGNSYGQWL